MGVFMSRSLYGCICVRLTHASISTRFRSLFDDGQQSDEVCLACREPATQPSVECDDRVVEP